MFKYILFSLFITFTLVVSEKPKLSCDSLAKYAKSDVDYTKMTGTWVGIKKFVFKDGYPSVPSNETAGKDMCCYVNLKGKETGFEMKKEFYKVGKPTKSSEMESIQIKDKPKGYFQIKSEVEKYNGGESILMDYIDNKYLMFMFCDKKEDGGENLAKHVFFLARYEDKVAATITEEQKQTMKDKYSDILYLTGTDIKPKYFGDYCWSKTE